MDRVGNVVVADRLNHAIRLVAKEGAVVSTLAGGRQEDDEENGDVETGFPDGTGVNPHFSWPQGVVVVANGDIFVSDSKNHAIRVISPFLGLRIFYSDENKHTLEAFIHRVSLVSKGEFVDPRLQRSRNRLRRTFFLLDLVSANFSHDTEALAHLTP